MDRPDYDLEDWLDASSAEQHRAFGNLTRHRMLGLLLDRAMTVTQLAEALGVLKGSASFHVRVLERAGLVRVIRTRQVRGAVERYYGRTARRYELDPPTGSYNSGMMLRTVAAELEWARSAGIGGDMVTVTRARLDPESAADFRGRLTALVEEFRVQPTSSPSGAPEEAGARSSGRAAAATDPAYTLAVALFQAEPGPADGGP